MALKVLLADDSAAIKKVVQLSLQDLGLELKSISSGKDAVDLAKKFKPDIAFIDVMLPQKSGYEVAAEIRKDPSLKNLPIVLLWSAFMAFDEAKYKTSGANAKLEKPFDAAALRALVTKLAPTAKSEAQSSPLAGHIELPNIEFEVPIGTVPPAKNKAAIKVEPKTEPKIEMQNDWSSSDFQDMNSFSAKIAESNTQVTKTVSPPLPEIGTIPPPPNQIPVATPDPASWNNDSEWVKKDLGKFSVPLPEDENKDAVPFEYSENKIVDTSFLFRPGDAGTATIFQEEKVATQNPSSTESTSNLLSASSLSIEELANIKLEAREIIEKIAWKLVPEMANQIIKEELDRLLSSEK
jgi:two-component system, cell cycle response regulator